MVENSSAFTHLAGKGKSNKILFSCCLACDTFLNVIFCYTDVEKLLQRKKSTMLFLLIFPACKYLEHLRLGIALFSVSLPISGPKSLITSADPLF